MEHNGIANPNTTPNTTQRSGKLAASDPAIWEHALGHELHEARAASLRGLLRIPTGLGKLAYLAILQRQLLDLHSELFCDWLGCSLQRKYEWLSRLLTSASCNGALPDDWLSASAYSELVPRSATTSDRDRYHAEMDGILEIIRKEIASSDPLHRECTTAGR